MIMHSSIKTFSQREARPAPLPRPARRGRARVRSRFKAWG